MLSRRQVVKTLGVAGGTLFGSSLGPSLAESVAIVQTGQTAQPQSPPSTVTNPPRDFGPNGAPTTYFTDPDVLAVAPEFGALVQANSAIKRVWTGALWAEGPAWCAQGRYLLW